MYSIISTCITRYQIRTQCRLPKGTALQVSGSSLPIHSVLHPKPVLVRHLCTRTIFRRLAVLVDHFLTRMVLQIMLVSYCLLHAHKAHQSRLQLFGTRTA
jgi:hypothetical protein